MQKIVKNIPAILFTAILLLLISTGGIGKAGDAGKCDVDTARITAVEFTVYGMDSITINDVQDALDTTCGVNFNFACWTDTVVFVEYDSLLTTPGKLMELIRTLGYQPHVRAMY